MRNMFLAAAAVASALSAPIAAQAQNTVGVVGGNTVVIEQDGGIIADQWHWSAIFWLNVPLGLLTALLARKAMKRLPRHDRTHKLDILGASLVMAAATALLLALTLGGTRFSWMSPEILGFVAASIAILSISSSRTMKAMPGAFRSG